MRIEEHPILGTYQKGKTVTFTLDGKEMQGCEGEPIAAALKAAGEKSQSQMSAITGGMGGLGGGLF